MKKKIHIDLLLGNRSNKQSKYTIRGVMLSEIARGDAGLAMIFADAMVLNFIATNFATKEQQNRIIPIISSLQ